MTKEIQRTSHPLVQLWGELRSKKRVRQEQRAVFVEGLKLVRELAEMGIVQTLITIEEQRRLFARYACEHVVVSSQVMRKLSAVEAYEGVAAIVSLPQESALAQAQAIVALDRVSDPGNLGTILRTALALGWHGAFLLDGCCDPYNDKALRAAKGATFRLPWQEGSWQKLAQLVQQQHFTMLAADLQGVPLAAVERPHKPLLVLGNESLGLSKEAQQLCQRITIPLAGDMESLNVGAAAAILIYALAPTALGR